MLNVKTTNQSQTRTFYLFSAIFTQLFYSSLYFLQLLLAPTRHQKILRSKVQTKILKIKNCNNVNCKNLIITDFINKSLYFLSGFNANLGTSVKSSWFSEQSDPSSPTRMTSSLSTTRQQSPDQELSHLLPQVSPQTKS